MRWLKLLGILIFIIILRQLDWGLVKDVFQQIRWPFLGASLFLIFSLVVTKASRWYLLVRRQGINYQYGNALTTYLCGLYLGFITPGRLGDMIKAVYLKREANVPLASGFASVIFDRLLDLFTLIIMGTFALVYYFYSWLNIWTLILPIALFITLIMVFFDKRLGNKVINLIFKKLELASQHFGTVQLSFDRFHDGLAELLPNSAQAVAMTILAYFFFFTSSYLVALSLNIKIAFLPFILAVSLSSLSTFIPISISGLGTREAVFITIFHQLGLSKEQAVSYTVLSLVVFNLFIGSCGFLAWQLKGGKEVTGE